VAEGHGHPLVGLNIMKPPWCNPTQCLCFLIVPRMCWGVMWFGRFWCDKQTWYLVQQDKLQTTILNNSFMFLSWNQIDKTCSCHFRDLSDNLFDSQKVPTWLFGFYQLQTLWMHIKSFINTSFIWIWNFKFYEKCHYNVICTY
jgi:hypothetical protein